MRKRRSDIRTVTLSRAWDLTVRDAERIAALTGIAGVRFAPAITRGNGGPRIAVARLRDWRGARFCAAERKEVVA